MPYSFNIGSIKCHIVSDGQQLIDGGSFFGLVPRVLWERVIQPDEKNRIPAQMRCLLVESPEGTDPGGYRSGRQNQHRVSTPVRYG